MSPPTTVTVHHDQGETDFHAWPLADGDVLILTAAGDHADRHRRHVLRRLARRCVRRSGPLELEHEHQVVRVRLAGLQLRMEPRQPLRARRAIVRRLAHAGLTGGSPPCR